MASAYQIEPTSWPWGISPTPTPVTVWAHSAAHAAESYAASWGFQEVDPAGWNAWIAHKLERGRRMPGAMMSFRVYKVRD